MFKELNIMQLFFNEPSREFGVREAAKLLEVAPATASKDLAELAENGFLKVREDRRMILYSSNIDNDYYRDLKVFHTIRTIKEKKLLESLGKFYTNSTIILFGSSSNGTDKEISDIDIAIISDKTDSFPEKEQYEKIFGRKLKFFVAKTLSEFNNKDIIRSVVNGKILQGNLEVEK